MNIDKLSSQVVRLVENASPEATDLFLKNQRLAYDIANRAASSYREKTRGSMGSYDLEDFTQEALLGLYDAAERFDPSKGLQFSTLAHKAITNRIRGLVKTGLRKKRAFISTDLDTPITGPEGEGDLTRLDTIADPTASGKEDREDSLAVLRDAITKVTKGNERDRNVLLDLMTHGDDFDMRSAGAEHGVTHTYIKDIINKYTPLLKRLLKSRGVAGYDDKGLVPAEQTRAGEYDEPRKRGLFKRPALATDEGITKFFLYCNLLKG